MNLMEKFRARLKGVPEEKPPEVTILQHCETDNKIKKTGPQCKDCGEELVFLRTLVLDEKNKNFIKIPVTAATVRNGDVRFNNSRHEAHRFCPNADRNAKTADAGVERRKTLETCMESTILHYRDSIINEGRWKPSEKTHEAEAEIERLQHAVLAGEGKLLDFSAACEEWQRIGETNN